MMVRDGGLELENVRVLYGSSGEYAPSEAHGALYATGSMTTLRKLELGSSGSYAPALIIEQGNKPSRLTVEESKLIGSIPNVIIRGPVKAKFYRTEFDGAKPLVAWLDASVELSNCLFKATASAVVNVYEGAAVVVTGAQRPRIDGTRGSDATSYERAFGPSAAAVARGGFMRDIFRKGRKPGTLP